MMKFTFLRAAAVAACALAFSPFAGTQAVAQKALKKGDVLTGSLNAMKVRVKGKRVERFQLTSAARSLPAPYGLCDLTTGPETFELVDETEAQTAQLQALLGKTVSVRVAEVKCAAEAGQYSEAVVTKWSIVGGVKPEKAATSTN